MKQTLFIMLGYPGSGKSYFARKLAQRIGAVRISQDSIRKNTFEKPREHMNPEDDIKLLRIMNSLTYDSLAASNSVIYDANVEKYADRASVYAIASKLGVHTCLIWVKTPLSVVLKRNGPVHEDKEFERAYKQMVNDYEQRQDKPKNDEPTIIIDGEETFEKQFLHFMSVLNNSESELR